ncbi:hypothetical protein DRQ33_03925 [bacterium]|nr:MAG: hypothetical protein DRQ33_03925 [bacterium]
MRNKIIVFSIFMLVIGMMILVGCSKSTDSDKDDNGTPPDTTQPDTTKPDSTAMGTLQQVYSLDTDEAPSYFDIDSSLLVYASSYRIRIYSVANPEIPQELSVYPPDYPYVNMISDVNLADTLLFFILDNPAKKLIVLNIADPYSPQQIGELEFTNTPQCIGYGNELIFVGYGGSLNGSIVDVSEPTIPVITGTIPCAFSACDYFNHKLYCTNINNMVYEVEVHSPISASVSQSANTGGENLDVAITPWGHLYIARGVQTGTNIGAFIAYYSDQIGLESYSEQINGWSVKNIDYDNNFVYLLLRPAGVSSIYYELRVYFAYHLDQTTLAHQDSIIYANCLVAENNYLYVGTRSTTTSGGNILVFHHQY